MARIYANANNGNQCTWRMISWLRVDSALQSASIQDIDKIIDTFLTGPNHAVTVRLGYYTDIIYPIRLYSFVHVKFRRN